MSFASDSGPGAIDPAGLFEPHGYIPEFSWMTFPQDWDGARLDFSVKGDPADRSYVVYAVVEEGLTGSGQVLHTAVKLPINGLLTYVP